MFATDLLSETGRGDFLEALKPRPAGEKPPWPKANSIKRGEMGEIPRVAEDVPALISRAQDCYQGLKPGNGWHGWLIDQIAVTTLRLDRCGRADRRLRDAVVIRAGLCWDEDRKHRAEVAGKRIAEVPQAVVCDLRSSPHGCDWLIRRWALLGQAAEGGAKWTPAQVALAHDLLETPAEDRESPPGRTFGGADGLTPVVPDRADLARSEIAGLKRRKAEVAHHDAIDRAMVEADLVLEPTLDQRRLGRHEAMLRGWLKWLVAQVRLDPPKRFSPADLYPQIPEVEPDEKPEAEVAAKAEAPATAGAADEVEAEPETTPEVAQGTLPRIARGTRKDPKVGRDEARRESRRRKRECRRA